jgi:hypothetical protein
VPKRKPEPGPLLGPQTEGDWIRATLMAIQHPSATERDRQEFRTLLALRPDLYEGSGDLARMAQRERRGPLAKNAYLDESMKHYLRQLRASLGYETASALERLLIDVILGAWQDYHLFAMVYGQRTSESFTLRDMEQWERVLASKEARYLRAIEELPRVRRLLKLPALQVNIAAAGGQQVNIAGQLTAGRLAPKELGGLECCDR